MKKVGETSLPDGIQEGFTEEVTFRKLTVKTAKHRKANRSRWVKAEGKKGVAWAPGPSPASSDA